MSTVRCKPCRLIFILSVNNSSAAAVGALCPKAALLHMVDTVVVDEIALQKWYQEQEAKSRAKKNKEDFEPGAFLQDTSKATVFPEFFAVNSPSQFIPSCFLNKNSQGESKLSL